MLAAGTPGLGAAIAAASNEEVSTEVYLGVVKSYNGRRGFGFLACAETAERFRRDVYMPKAEATAAAVQATEEAAAEVASAMWEEVALLAVQLGEDPCSTGAKYREKDALLAFRLGEDPCSASAKYKEKDALLALQLGEDPSSMSAKYKEKDKDKGKEMGKSKDPGKERDKVQDTDKDDNEGEKSEKPPKAPRLAEEDLVQFQVKPSTEGYPQAVRVRLLRKFSGVVGRLPHEGRAGESGVGAIVSEEATSVLGILEVPLRREACGQLRLAVGDEVTFCVPTLPNVPQAIETGARLVFLSKTSRSNRSVFGCFTLDLPRTGGAEEKSPGRPSLQLDCHAFGDRLILAGVPEDLDEAELMRFFSKQGATRAIVAKARSSGFASVSFPGTMEVARFLGHTAHAFADDKETRIAKLLSLVPSEHAPRLPALPSPTLSSAAESGSLLVSWSTVVLAVTYTLELRPAGGVWTTVDDASSGNRFDSYPSSNGKASRRMTGLRVNTFYEARVSYFTEYGTRSDASEPSEPCLTALEPKGVAAAPAMGSGLGAAGGFGTAVAVPPGLGNVNGGFALGVLYSF